MERKIPERNVCSARASKLNLEVKYKFTASLFLELYFRTKNIWYKSLMKTKLCRYESLKEVTKRSK